MNTSTISIIIPAFNEEEYIESTIRTVMNLPYNKEVIVIDDGSKDRTKEVLQELVSHFKELQVIHLRENQGKGQALMNGVMKSNGNVLVFLDADLGETTHYVTKLIRTVIDGYADMSIAVLPPAKKKGGFGFVKKLAQKGIFTLTGYQVTSPLSGQRALKREVMTNVKLLERGFGIEVGLTIDALKNGYKIKEVEVPFSHRETGRDFAGFLHRGKEFRDIMITLLKKWRTSQ